jgi:RNA polymerase sigma-70 factor (ECF subfamily)
MLIPAIRMAYTKNLALFGHTPANSVFLYWGRAALCLTIENLQPANTVRMIHRGGKFSLGIEATMPNGQAQDQRYREFVRLLAEHERRLTAYVHALIPLWQDAEDVLQDTKLRLWEQFDSFRPGSDFAAWAITVAGYMVRTYRTLCQRERVCFSDKLMEKLSESFLPVTASRVEDRLSALAECAKALNAAGRRLLRLVCVEHQRIKDIAGELGQTPAATRKALQRIRQSLFECVQKRLQEEQTR